MARRMNMHRKSELRQCEALQEDFALPLKIRRLHAKACTLGKRTAGKRAKLPPPATRVFVTVAKSTMLRRIKTRVTLVQVRTTLCEQMNALQQYENQKNEVSVQLEH